MSLDAAAIPVGWVRATLGDLVSLEYGKALREESRNGTGSVPVFGSSGRVGTHSSSLVNGPCLIVGRKGNVGAVHLAPEPCWPIDTVYFVQPPTGIDPSFLYHLLVHLRLGELDRSTAVPGLSRTDAYASWIAVPPPGEQRRIVEELEALLSDLDAAVRTLKRALEKLKRYRQAVLKAAVEGELSREWREAHRGQIEPASELLQRILTERGRRWEPGALADMDATRPSDRCGQSRGQHQSPETSTRDAHPLLPARWTLAMIEQLSDVETGATPLRSNAAYYGGNTPWVTSGALNREYIDSSEECITERAIEETNAKVLPAGTLLIAMYGEGKTRGKIAELRIDAATNQACAALVFSVTESEQMKPFIKLFFQKSYDDLRRLAAGGVQPNLNLGLIKATLVPLPPLEEQRFITTETDRLLGVVESLREALGKSLLRASSLRQSILEKAFRGELVPQDPNDEPASALLERIRAERAAAAKTKPVRTRRARVARTP